MAERRDRHTQPMGPLVPEQLVPKKEELNTLMSRVLNQSSSPEIKVALAENPTIKSAHAELTAAFRAHIANRADEEKLDAAIAAATNFFETIERETASVRIDTAEVAEAAALAKARLLEEKRANYRTIYETFNQPNHRWIQVDQNELRPEELANQTAKYIIVAEVQNPLAGEKISETDLGIHPKNIYFLRTATEIGALPLQVLPETLARTTLRAYINRTHVVKDKDEKTVFRRSVTPLYFDTRNPNHEWRVNTSYPTLDTDLEPLHENGWFTLDKNVLQDWVRGNNIDLKTELSIVSLAKVEKTPGNFEYFIHLDNDTAPKIPDGLTQETHDRGLEHFVLAQYAEISPKTRREEMYKRIALTSVDADQHVRMDNLDQAASDVAIEMFKSGWKIMGENLHDLWVNQKREILPYDYIGIAEVDIPGRPEPLFFCKPALQQEVFNASQTIQGFPIKKTILTRCSRIEGNNQVSHNLKEVTDQADGTLRFIPGTNAENAENNLYKAGFVPIESHLFSRWGVTGQIPADITRHLRLNPEEVINVVFVELTDTTNSLKPQYFVRFNFEPTMNFNTFLPYNSESRITGYETTFDEAGNKLDLSIAVPETKLVRGRSPEQREESNNLERIARRLMQKNEQIHALCKKLRELRGVDRNPPDINEKLKFIFGILDLPMQNGDGLAAGEMPSLDGDTAMRIVQLVSAKLRGVNIEELEKAVQETITTLEQHIAQEEAERATVQPTKQKRLAGRIAGAVLGGFMKVASIFVPAIKPKREPPLLPETQPPASHSFWRKPALRIANAVMALFMGTANPYQKPEREYTLETSPNDLPPKIESAGTWGPHAPESQAPASAGPLKDVAKVVKNLPVEGNTQKAEVKPPEKEQPKQTLTKTLPVQKGDTTIGLMARTIKKDHPELDEIKVRQAIAIVALKNAAHSNIEAGGSLRYQYEINNGKLVVQSIEHFKKDEVPKPPLPPVESIKIGTTPHKVGDEIEYFKTGSQPSKYKIAQISPDGSQVTLQDPTKPKAPEFPVPFEEVVTRVPDTEHKTYTIDGLFIEELPDQAYNVRLTTESGKGVIKALAALIFELDYGNDPSKYSFALLDANKAVAEANTFGHLVDTFDPTLEYKGQITNVVVSGDSAVFQKDSESGKWKVASGHFSRGQTKKIKK